MLTQITIKGENHTSKIIPNLFNNLLMRTEQAVYSQANNWVSKSNDNLSELAQLVFLFGDKNLLKEQKHFDYIRNCYPKAEIVGCSTSGDIYQEEIYDNSIVCTAVYFENTKLQVVCEQVDSMSDSFKIGERLLEQLNPDNLSHVFILSEGLNINGSELTKGMNSKLGNKVSITGGLAGDQANFSETVLVYNQPGAKNRVLAIGFYGQNLKIGYGSLGGWDSFGVDRLVTKSEANVLYELDGQPALELYKKYLGTHAANLPASALLFPLSFISKDEVTPLVRTILSIDETNGSMVFAGDIPEGCYVRLMKANFEKLIDGASGAAEMSKISLQNSDPDLAILISCVGRKLLMKQRIEEELEGVREIVGPSTVMTGFYSYGEISPVKPFEKHCELHNQTMTITVFKEL
jgi:hypothetical protein